MADTELQFDNTADASSAENDGQTNGSGTAGAERLSATAKKEPKIHKYLKFMVEHKASDLHFKSNQRGHVRHKGDLKPIGEVLTAKQVEDIWFEIMTPHHRKQLEENGASDFAYQLGGSDRFR